MKISQLRIGLAAALALMPALAHPATFQASGADASAWRKILGAVGMTDATKSQNASGSAPAVVVAGPDDRTDIASLAENRIVILEGLTPAGQKFGITARQDTVAIRQICDVHAPKMQIIWEQAVTVPAAELSAGFQIFATEKWKGVPVLAGRRTSHGAVLWMATPPGATGIERYPYLLQALADLGLSIPLRSISLWAFFDSSYRIRADADYLARRWRQAGVGILHVAAWHNVEPDPAQDAYLRNLIEACHRNAILVYAWLELPHVSEKFWADHPDWREKTAIGQDAQLDWRKLMNLQNPDCHREVAKEITQLLSRFDWDGVNVAELYFESLEGASNPARFTPMDDDVRQEFQRIAGFDPKLLFDPASPYNAQKNPEAFRKFLDFRAHLASRMQADWLDVIDQSRSSKPYLDVVLTHIDDRFEPGIRDALGADVARSLPLIQARHSTLLVEDPATLWNLGPERYAKLAEKYLELTPNRRNIAVDINVVERYQDVYPTKKQTGVELLELVHQAAVSFHRVALYFENSLEKQDLGLLPAAATGATATEKSVDEMEINAPEPTRVLWQGPAEIDSKIWPIQNANFVLAPAGSHRLSVGTAEPALTITDFNGEIRSAHALKDGVQLSYASRSRAIALLSSRVSTIEVDGAPFWRAQGAGDSYSFVLPAGQHLVMFSR